MRAFLLFLGLLPASPQDGEWAADWPDAARRARDEKKLVLVLVELYGGLEIPERLPAIFLDGPLADLKHHRFIGLRWKRGMKAPFQSPDVYGMGGSTFGAAILVAAPDGSIVGQFAPLSSSLLDQHLRALLRKHPEFPGLPLEQLRDPLDRAETLMKRGDLEEAEALLRPSTTARGFRLQATLFSRARRGDEALGAIRRARDLGGAGLEADLGVEEGTVLLGLGRTKDAAKVLLSVLERHPTHERVPEARFWLSHILLRDDLAEGKAGFEETVRTSKGTPWGRAAEAILASGALEAVAATRLGWPGERMLEIVREVGPKPLPVAEAARGREDAVRFLIRSQQEDGSWITCHLVTSEAPAFSMATTAICALGLLPLRDRKEIRAAVDRALDHVLAAVASSALDRQARAFGFGYSVWGRAFALRLLARCSREAIGDPARLSGAMKVLVRELARDQTAGGGWTYYAGIDPAFVTGAVVLALLDAKDAGMAVPDESVRRGLACLGGARAAPGKFRYSPGGAEPRAEAGPRGPLCELALRRGGKGEPGALEAALDHTLASRRDVRKERGKALCHTGPDGTASYYLLFGYAFAAEALADLPEDQRDPYRKGLLEDVLAARLEDGSFLDTPLIGRQYGAGMALSVLVRLVP